MRSEKSIKSLCFFLFFIEFTFFFSSGVLVLLVFGNEIVHVALGFGEFHLVHALTGVPVEEGFSSEHGGKLLGDPLEKLLDGGRVTNEGGRHFETSWWDVANSSFHVVRDPLDKVRRVLVLDVQKLFVDFFMDIRPRNIVATVRYLPCLGSQAAIMFLASNIC